MCRESQTAEEGSPARLPQSHRTHHGYSGRRISLFFKGTILMGCSRQYIYKLVAENKLPASRISSRMSFIRRADIEAMLAGNPYHRVLIGTQQKENRKYVSVQTQNFSSPSCSKYTPQDEVLDYISGEDAMRIYKVKKLWLYASAKRNNIPMCRIAFSIKMCIFVE